MLSDLERLPEIKLGDFTLRLELDELNDELREVARKELRENPDRQKEAVEELRALVKAEADLKAPWHKDAWLIRFLRPCKYYPESALNLVRPSKSSVRHLCGKAQLL